MTKKYMIANWKMNQRIKDIDNFFETFNKVDFDGNFIIAPQSLHLAKSLYLSKKAKIASQNISHKDFGAFTGEISPISLNEMKINYSIIGHSERRSIFGEDNHLINEKVKNALIHKITPILCIGESLEQRESNQTLEVISNQLKLALNSVSLKSSDDLIVAYEPVWAIGTGKAATSNEAEEIHKEIRFFLKKEYGDTGANISILYGGSVKPENISELLNKENIDGALVGGASLKAESFEKLCKATL